MSPSAPPANSVQAAREWLRTHPRWAWKHGVLWYKLDDHQLKTYWRIRRALTKPFAQFTLNWARRTGKTFLLLLIVTEECLRNRSHRYNIAAATKESLHGFVWPALELIFSDCPNFIRQTIRMREQKGRVEFKKASGRHSLMVLAGCNDKRSVERLRGPYSNGNLVEEMGAIPESPGLRYILTSILNPQLMTTDGWTLKATTPPPSAGHAAAHMVLMAEAVGNYSHATLYDNPRLSSEKIQAYLESDAAALGMTVDEYKESADFRREWLAIIETDPNLAVLPRFTADKKAKVVCEATGEPIFWDGYAAMDIGFSPHWTALLYARWSFQHQRLRIVGERLIRRMGTPELAAAVKEDEAAHFGKRQPFLRVSDNNNPILLHDLSNIFGLVFQETAKDNLRAAVSEVNRWIGDLTIEIDPSCKMLIAQMTAATWAKKGKEFAESVEFGHFDLIAALVYLVRNVIPNINRVPPEYGKSIETHWIPPPKATPEEKALESLFTPYA